MISPASPQFVGYDAGETTNELHDILATSQYIIGLQR